VTVYIYSRVSTDRQETENQLHAMRAKFPDAETVEETASGAGRRPVLDALLTRLQGGDTLVVYALDRLGRRCGELVVLLDRLNRDGVVLVSLREGIDLGTLGGRFTAQIFAALAELERGLIAERTRAALQAKRAAGVRLGRPQSVPQETYDLVIALTADGHGTMEIARRTGLAASTVSKFRKRLKLA